MKLPKMGWSALLCVLATLVPSDFQFSGNCASQSLNSAALASTPAERKAEADRLLQQGNQQLFTSQFEAALRSYQQTLTIYRELKDRLGEGNGLNNLGVVYRNLGDYGKAIEYFQQSLAISREIKDRLGEGIALSNLGFTLYSQGNLPVAEKTLLDAIKVLESLRTGLDDAKKISIFDTQTDPYLDLQKVLIAQKKTNEALEIAERGRARAFVELLAARLAPSAQITINPPNIEQIQQIASEQNATLVEYSTIKNEALYIWVIKPTGEITFRSVDLKSLNINLRQAAERTRLNAATGRGLNEPDTVFAEMIRGTRDALRTSENNLSHQQNSTANSETANPKLQELYQLLIEPIADFLPTDPNAPVIFIPHQSLFLVPFATLQNAQGQYLIENHTILTAPALQVLQLTRQSRQKIRQLSPQNIVVVGNPTMPKIGNPPEQLAPLPGSEQEAQIIAKLLNTQAIISTQATKISIVQKMLNARIVHLATHGLLGALCQGKLLAPMVYQGYCTAKVIESWLRHFLLPQLRPGQVIIMDNAPFHKSNSIKKLLSSVGCELLFLPSYSPDLNPIEHWWQKIKTAIRKELPKYEFNVHQAADAAFRNM